MNVLSGLLQQMKDQEVASKIRGSTRADHLLTGESKEALANLLVLALRLESAIVNAVHSLELLLGEDRVAHSMHSVDFSYHKLDFFTSSTRFGPSLLARGSNSLGH